MPSSPAILVTVGGSDSYSMFGVGDGEEYHVHVTPSRARKPTVEAPGSPSSTHGGVWNVICMAQSKYLEQAKAGSVRGKLKSYGQFAALDSALQAEQASLSLKLPHLPLRPSLVAATSAEPSARELSFAAQLQEYLAELCSHPEVPWLPPFVEFIAASAGDAAADVSEPLGSPSLARARSISQLDLKEGTGAPPAGCTRVKLSWVDEEGEHEAELPVLSPNGGMGNRVIDVRALGAKTGFFTHDPGFTSTSSCVSAITYIDGDKGVLLHRGYRIADLASRCTFPEVAFLLIEGELPTPAELHTFDAELKQNWMVHEKLLTFFQGFRSDAHPMAIMVGVCGALSAFYPDSMNIHQPEQRRVSAIRLIAKMPTIAAICYKTTIGEPVVYPSNRLSFASNFLRMMFATPCCEYEVDPVHAKALETIFILHADHEQNASTSTVRIASSSQANPFACIAAGIASLWGPAHGGANEAVLRMLDEIKTPERIPLFLAKAKDKSDPFRLMGFGHRVYKNFDPRATLMRQVCKDVLGTLSAPSAELKLAQQLEEAALADEYFVSRKLYPNVDFYSGIVLRALGFPRSMFTVIFAVARSVGWLAQWNESFADAQQRISRPRQLYVGVPERDFVPREARSE